MRKTLIIILVPLAVLAAAVVALGVLWLRDSPGVSNAKADNASLGDYGCTDAQEPVLFSVASDSPGVRELRMEMPAHYLGYSNNWAGGEQQLVRINVQLPSLRARPSGTFWRSCETDADKGRRDSAWPVDYLRIKIGAGVVGHFVTPEDYVEIPSGTEGLAYMQRKCAPKTEPPTARACTREFVYVPVEAGAAVPEGIECIGAVQNPSSSCEGIVTFRGHKILFTFKHDQLPRWRELTAATLEVMTRYAR